MKIQPIVLGNDENPYPGIDGQDEMIEKWYHAIQGRKNRLPRLDYNRTYDLIEKLISCGFRGAAQKSVDTVIEEYQKDIVKNKETAKKPVSCESCNSYGCRAATADCGPLNGYPNYHPA